jgi:predicted nucleic acid-binding protein
MVKVLDACALMAYLEKETGYEKVKELFVKAVESEKNVMMTTVNWGEVFYILVREYGIGEAEKIQRVIETFPIDFVTVDVPLAKQAALYKATKKLPYADCFAAALAKLHKGEVVTGDKEFIELESDIKITLIL